MTTEQLPLPPHYDVRTAGQIRKVRYAEVAEDARVWAALHGIRPAHEDAVRFALLLIDQQITFCLPSGELYVIGAVDDSARIAEFIYRNLHRITEIIVTMDSHTVIHIYHPKFWVGRDGGHPVGNQTLIHPVDVDNGTWRPNPDIVNPRSEWKYLRSYDELARYARYYVEAVQKDGGNPLMVWGYHAPLMGIGHAIVPIVEEAIFFHSIARGVDPRVEIKGRHPLTENFSVFEADVTMGPDGDPLFEGTGTPLLEYVVGRFDVVAAAGEAKSHCVKWALEHMRRYMEFAIKHGSTPQVYLLEDCTSPVVVPGVVDFTNEADEAFARFEKDLMWRVRSTDPVETWKWYGGVVGSTLHR